MVVGLQAANPLVPVERFSVVYAMNSDDTDTDEEGVLIRKAVQLQQHQELEQADSLTTLLPVVPSPPPPHLAPLPPPSGSLPSHEAAPIIPPPPRATTPKGGKGKSSSRRPAGAITIKTLVDAGLLIPGPEVLYVDYKGSSTYADLSSEGQIHCKGLVFDSPSAFSIYIKRLVNPTRKADDGWKAVKYNGKLLEAYKDEYLRRLMPGPSALQTADGSSLGGSLDAPAGVLAPVPPPPPPASSLSQGIRGGPPAKRHRSSASLSIASPSGAPEPPVQPSLPPLTSSGSRAELVQQQGSRGPPIPPPPPLLQPSLSHGFNSNLWPGSRAGLPNDNPMLLHSDSEPAAPLGIQPMIELNSQGVGLAGSPR